MAIKSFIIKTAEKITGRKCSRCAHNCGGHCAHHWEGMFARCWKTITRPGWTRKSEVVEYAKAGQACAEGFLDGYGNLTEEEKYQLQKIREALECAEDMARESGLITED